MNAFQLTALLTDKPVQPPEQLVTKHPQLRELPVTPGSRVHAGGTESSRSRFRVLTEAAGPALVMLCTSESACGHRADDAP